MRGKLRPNHNAFEAGIGIEPISGGVVHMAKEVLGNVDAQPLQTVMPVMDNILKTVREKEGIPSDPSARYLPALTRGELGKQVAVNEFKGVPPNKSPKEIRRWILDRVGDEDILNDYTQWEVGPKSGTKHTVNTNRGVKQWFAGETAQLIKDSIWLGRERHKDYPKSKIKWQHLFYTPFTYEGQLWVAKLRVNETIHGEKLRDTRFAEVKTLAKDSSEEPTPSTGTDASQVNVARLADIVKRLWPKDDVQLVRPENERRAKLDADLRIQKDLQTQKRNK